MTAPVWLLTVNWSYEDENGEPDSLGDAMQTHQSLHSDKDGALLRLFDAVYAINGSTPKDTEVLTSCSRDDGADFADLDADGEYITYSLIPLTIETREGE